MLRTGKRGISLIEVLTVLTIVGLLLSILIPAVQWSREASRRTTCQSRLRQLGLALLHYETAHQSLPPGRLTPDWVHHGQVMADYTNYTRVSQSHRSRSSTGFRSVHSVLLPYFEQAAVYDQIDFEHPCARRMTRRGEPYNVNFKAYAQSFEVFLCPSDRVSGRTTTETNFRYNFGGSTPYGGAENTHRQNVGEARQQGLSCRGNGAFTIGRGLRMAAFRRGLSQTATFAERVRGSGVDPNSTLPTRADIVTMPRRQNELIAVETIYQRCGEYQPRRSPFNFTATGRWLAGSDYSNGWPFAGYACTMYNHVAPPNWEGFDCGNWSAIPDTPGEHAILSARSAHPAGVNVVFGDGHLQFIDDHINLQAWRSLGSRDTPSGVE